MFRKFQCTCESRHFFKVYWDNGGVRVKNLSPSMALKEKLGHGRQLCDGIYGDFVTFKLKPTGDPLLNRLYRMSLRDMFPFSGLTFRETCDKMPSLKGLPWEDPEGFPVLFPDGCRCVSRYAPVLGGQRQYPFFYEWNFKEKYLFLGPECEAVLYRWILPRLAEMSSSEVAEYFQSMVYGVVSFMDTTPEDLKKFLETEGQACYDRLEAVVAAFRAKLDSLRGAL